MINLFGYLKNLLYLCIAIKNNNIMNINDLQKGDWVILSTRHMSDYQEVFDVETRDELFYSVHVPRQITNIQRSFNHYSGDMLSYPCSNDKFVNIDGVEINFDGDRIEPIEITSKLLEKNGFQYVANGYVIPYFEYDDVRLIYDTASEMYMLVLSIDIEGSKRKEPISNPFKYFHELQHYLRDEASLRQNDDFIFDEHGNFLFDKEFTLIL